MEKANSKQAVKRAAKRTAGVVLCGVLALVWGLGPAPRAHADIPSATDKALVWLKHQQDETKGFAFDGLVDSFEDYWAPNTPKQIVYTYDQAVAATAFIAAGDRARAEKILNKMRDIQDPSGYWLNSYWYNNGAGEEIREHVGPVVWVAMAVMAYEKQYGDTRYRNMAVKALDWSLQYQQANGGVAGGWSGWTNANEPWTSTEHNLDIYPTLRYFASAETSRASAYNTAAARVKTFLDTKVWNDSRKNFYGGWKNDTNLVDPFVPMDVNPWGVLALGLSGAHDYQSALSYVENANGNPGTLANPRYKYTLTYDNAGNTMTAYDFDWDGANNPLYDAQGNLIGYSGPDIWLEGSAFMSAAYYLQGNTAKADSILNELAKKQGTSGASTGGLPYSLKGTSNSYWVMAQQNSVSSTGWFVLAAKRFNPFQGSFMNASGNPGGGNNGGGSNPGTGTGTEIVTTDYKINVTNSGGARIVFTPATSALYVDIHYKLDNGPQQNLRMSGSGTNWNYTVAGWSAGKKLEYWFTYEKSGPQYDSPHYTFTQ
ncbi:hypothetical protein QWJ34_25755 [Saccharibacillus sp. CPCC 101409]|uniref:hypothetical protein n=1 Tax=Saccharibacillus sp. CPCC 101409 TaxID=3058041 RepID=UPI002672BDC4|nr:hypothetical protein [Saccharibacillus sp. CPCC 101409]MDO3413183.1 hypothetical protein [Saccharibacillus sp. CPCC 101409]